MVARLHTGMLGGESKIAAQASRIVAHLSTAPSCRGCEARAKARGETSASITGALPA